MISRIPTSTNFHNNPRENKKITVRWQVASVNRKVHTTQLSTKLFTRSQCTAVSHVLSRAQYETRWSCCRLDDTSRYEPSAYVWHSVSSIDGSTVTIPVGGWASHASLLTAVSFFSRLANAFNVRAFNHVRKL